MQPTVMRVREKPNVRLLAALLIGLIAAFGLRHSVEGNLHKRFARELLSPGIGVMSIEVNGRDVSVTVSANVNAMTGALATAPSRGCTRHLGAPMPWFVIDAVLIMLGCLLLGALMAWLLAVALYPTRAEALAMPRSPAGARDDRQRDERRAEPYRAETHCLDDDAHDGEDRDIRTPDDRHDAERVNIHRESCPRVEGGRFGDERSRLDGASATAESMYQTLSELRSQARKAGRGGRR